MNFQFRHVNPALFTGLLICVGAPGFAQLELVEKTTGTAELTVYGDVKTVLDGNSTGTAFQAVRIGRYLAALGCASMKDDESSQGEALLLGGTAFVKSVDPATSYTTQSRRGPAWASFLAGLTSRSKPAARYRLGGNETLTIEKLYAKLHEKHGGLIAVIGTATFPSLELSAVKKAPAYGEPILGDRRAEYFHPTEKVENRTAVFFGMSMRSTADATPLVRRVFYVNPQDTSSAGQSHTHCGILRDAGDETDPFKNVARVETAAHVLTQSQIQAGELLVYELAKENR